MYTVTKKGEQLLSSMQNFMIYDHQIQCYSLIHHTHQYCQKCFYLENGLAHHIRAQCIHTRHIERKISVNIVRNVLYTRVVLKHTYGSTQNCINVNICFTQQTQLTRHIGIQVEEEKKRNHRCQQNSQKSNFTGH